MPTGVFISMLLYALPVVAQELPTYNREKIFLKRGLTYLIEYAITKASKGGGQLRKEGTPMSVEETIALLMLVIAAISLGIQIKK